MQHQSQNGNETHRPDRQAYQHQQQWQSTTPSTMAIDGGPPPPPPPSTASTLPLPPGWVRATDPISGETYYANTLTGQTSWDPPPPQVVGYSSNPIPIPPPPPHPPRNTSSNTNDSALSRVINEGMMIPSLPNTTSLIISTRTTIQKSIAAKASNATTQCDYDGVTEEEMEFEQMSAGRIADLAHVQVEYYSGTSDADGSQAGGVVDMSKNPRRYEPLRPFEMPLTLKAPHIEPGRVEIRLMSLMESLRKI